MLSQESRIKRAVTLRDGEVTQKGGKLLVDSVKIAGLIANIQDLPGRASKPVKQVYFCFSSDCKFDRALIL
jgi:hypothetical protein